MAITNAFIKALRNMGKTSAVPSTIGDVAVDSVRRYGEFTQNSRIFGDMSDVAEEVGHLKGILNGQIDDAFMRAGVNPDDTVPNIGFKPVEHYKKQLNKVLGGNKGVGELLKGMPEDFRPKLEALAGELQTKIISDIDDIRDNFRKLYHEGVTDGHLSLHRYQQSAVDNHMQEINETLRQLTKPFIDSTPYKSWDDFQRLNWNDEIMDYHKSMAGVISEYNKAIDATQNVVEKDRLGRQAEKIKNQMESFNEHNSIVLKGNELVDTRYLKWIHASDQNATIHYLAKNGDKYSILVRPDGRRGLSNLTREAKEAMPNHWDESNEYLHIEVNRLYSNERQRVQKHFGKDPLEDIFEFSQKKELDKFAHKEGIEDTNNVIRALKTLGLGADYSSDSMSQSSLQLLGLLAKKAKKKTERVENLLERGLANPDYIGKTKIYDYDQPMNEIRKRFRSPIAERRRYSDNAKTLEYQLLPSYSTRMSANVELNPFRKIDGVYQRDQVGKNINIDGFYQGRNLDEGHRTKLKNAVNAIMEEEGNIRYTAKSLLDRIQKEGKFSRKLDVVNTLITQLDNAVPGLSYTRFLDDTLPAGTSHKEFVLQLADEVVDIEKGFKQQFGENAKLTLKFSANNYDDAGRLTGDMPTIYIQHSGVSVRETLSAKDFLKQNFGFAAPLAPGFKIEIEDD